MDTSELQELEVSPGFAPYRIILQPPELVGEGLSAYERYPIVSSQSQPPVSHRYSDFEALRTLLSKKFPACVIPPLPPRTLLKMSISSYFITDPDFLETRRRGLEEFLNEILSHHKLKTSSDVHTFLSSSDTLLPPTEPESWGSKLISFGWSCGSRLTQAVSRAPAPVTKTEEDWKFDEIKSDVALWQSHLERLMTHIDEMVEAAKALGACFYGLGVPLEKLNKAAAGGDGVAMDTTAISSQMNEHAVQLKDVILCGLDRNIRTLSACTEALERREKDLVVLHEAYARLSECRERLVRDKRAAQSVKDEEGKVKALEAALKDMSEELRVESDHCLGQMKTELARLLRDYSALQLSCQEAMGRRWREASERLLV